MPEVTKAVALVLLLGALTVVPPRHRLLTVLMLPGRTTPEDGALGAEVAAVEKAAEDGVLSTLAWVCGVLVDRVAWVEDKLLWWLERELLS